MKLFIVTFVDLWNVGFPCSGVDVFKTYDEAYEHMRGQYIEACKNEDMNPFDEYSYDNSISNVYAYISDKFYWDIFEKEI